MELCRQRGPVLTLKSIRSAGEKMGFPQCFLLWTVGILIVMLNVLLKEKLQMCLQFCQFEITNY